MIFFGEQGNEPSGSVRRGDFFFGIYLLKKDSGAWI